MKRITILAGLALAFFASGCGDGIPSAYQGDFVESRTGAKLKLRSESGEYQETGGRSLKGQSYEMLYEDLARGRSGVYFKDSPNNKNILELYWLNPDLKSRQEAAGIQYIQTEVFYFRFDRSHKGKVDQFQSVHSHEGVLSLDAPTKQWQVGWPAGSETLEFLRFAD